MKVLSSLPGLLVSEHCITDNVFYLAKAIFEKKKKKENIMEKTCEEENKLTYYNKMRDFLQGF